MTNSSRLSLFSSYPTKHSFYAIFCAEQIDLTVSSSVTNVRRLEQGVLVASMDGSVPASLSSTRFKLKKGPPPSFSSLDR